MPGRTRDPYADVGAATRAAIERAMPELTLQEARVLLALVSLMSTWSKLSDRLYSKQIAAAAGMEERNAKKIVAKLARDGIITVERTPGRRSPSIYRWPDPAADKRGKRTDTSGEAHHGSDHPNSGEPDHGEGDQGSGSPWSADAVDHGGADHPPENYTEVITPLPPSEPAGGHDPAHTGQHPNCRACGTNPRGHQPLPGADPAPPGPRPWAATPEDPDVETRLHVVPPPEVHGPPHPLTRHRWLQTAGGAA